MYVLKLTDHTYAKGQAQIAKKNMDTTQLTSDDLRSIAIIHPASGTTYKDAVLGRKGLTCVCRTFPVHVQRLNLLRCVYEYKVGTPEKGTVPQNMLGHISLALRLNAETNAGIRHLQLIRHGFWLERFLPCIEPPTLPDYIFTWKREVLGNSRRSAPSDRKTLPPHPGWP